MSVTESRKSPVEDREGERANSLEVDVTGG